MQVRPISPSEIEAARQLLIANGWDRGVSIVEEFDSLNVEKPQCEQAPRPVKHRS